MALPSTAIKRLIFSRASFNYLAILIDFSVLEILVALVYHVVEQQPDVPNRLLKMLSGAAIISSL